MRQALDRLAQRAWSNRKGLPEPALDRSTSSPMAPPRISPQVFQDPPSPAVIPSAANRTHATALHGANRHHVWGSGRNSGAVGNRRDSATSRDMTGALMGCLPACLDMYQCCLHVIQKNGCSSCTSSKGDQESTQLDACIKIAGDFCVIENLWLIGAHRCWCQTVMLCGICAIQQQSACER